MQRSTRQRVPDAVLFGARCILALIWAGAIATIALGRPSAYAWTGAVLTAGAGTAFFLPFARGWASPQWFTEFAALVGILYVANRLEAALSGPWWWYAVTALLCAVVALAMPLRTPLVRSVAAGGMIILIGVGARWGSWGFIGSSLATRLEMPSWLLITMLCFALAIRIRVAPPQQRESGDPRVAA
jgi:hypothetical protein